jgi:4-oxalocrotonate tautomerase
LPQNVPSIEEGESPMPFINIRIAKDGTTAAQKEALIAGATKLLQDVLNKNPKTTFVIIDEVDTDNWGVGGESVTNIRKRG